MNAEPAGRECARQRDGLLRLACGDSARPADRRALDAHLAACARCARLLREWQELTGTLAAALRAEPLPAGLRRRIGQRLGGGAVAPGRRRAWGRVGAAAAAALLAAVFLPPAQPPTAGPGPADGPARVVRSERDAAAIVAALNLLEWSDPWEYSLGRLTRAIDDLEQTVQRSAAGDGLLPWGPADDWDTPAGPPASQPGQSAAPHSAAEACRIGGPAARPLFGERV